MTHPLGYRFQKRLPVVPAPSRINPVHAIPTDLFNIRFNIIVPSTRSSYKLSLSLRFPHHNPVCTSHLIPSCAGDG